VGTEMLTHFIEAFDLPERSSVYRSWNTKGWSKTTCKRLQKNRFPENPVLISLSCKYKGEGENGINTQLPPWKNLYIYILFVLLVVLKKDSDAVYEPTNYAILLLE
jgi:hypothetical protein